MSIFISTIKQAFTPSVVSDANALVSSLKQTAKTTLPKIEESADRLNTVLSNIAQTAETALPKIAESVGHMNSATANMDRLTYEFADMAQNVKQGAAYMIPAGGLFVGLAMADRFSGLKKVAGCAIALYSAGVLVKKVFFERPSVVDLLCEGVSEETLRQIPADPLLLKACEIRIDQLRQTQLYAWNEADQFKLNNLVVATYELTKDEKLKEKLLGIMEKELGPLSSK